MKLILDIIGCSAILVLNLSCYLHSYPESYCEEFSKSQYVKSFGENGYDEKAFTSKSVDEQLKFILYFSNCTTLGIWVYAREDFIGQGAQVVPDAIQFCKEQGDSGVTLQIMNVFSDMVWRYDLDFTIITSVDVQNELLELTNSHDSSDQNDKIKKCYENIAIKHGWKIP
jgi:hypothetical protein